MHEPPCNFCADLTPLSLEDFYLLHERPAAGEAVLPAGGKLAAPYDRGDHAEDHPSQKTHVLVAGASCFSFNVGPWHMKPMAAIHHPNVPGWYLHLQRGMNRLFADLEPAAACRRGPGIPGRVRAPRRAASRPGGRAAGAVRSEERRERVCLTV